MANNVGQFCLAISVDAAESEDDIFNKPPYLLCLIVLVELEMKKIFLGELQLENILNNIVAENIDVEIYFLLVFLDADVSNNLNNGNWLNEVMEKDIKQINAEVTVIWSADVALKPHYVVEPFKHLPSQHSNPLSDDDEIMGFDIEIKKLIRHLTRRISELDVIPTVGMGNKGKRLLLERCRIIRALFLTSMFEHGLEGMVEEEEDDDDSILDYEDDEDQEATQAEIEELFGDLGETNGTML
ncbi:hypothetical protein T459_09157 [Capsicum annuum]|uniref:Uncharacterized protein n=1 Tax=Capsicum annuum TaxID=4072 RepID=A0A2G2ZYM8_CAPAN|nr:hypothetical protein T459_09157 [Capsicum annuum]